MSLKISRNISVIQDYYYLQMNKFNFNRPGKGWSSCFVIDSASDHLLGLVFSGKNSAQSEGLYQSIRNQNMFSSESSVCCADMAEKLSFCRPQMLDPSCFSKLSQINPEPDLIRSLHKNRDSYHF